MSKSPDNLFFKTAVHQCDDLVVVTDSDALIVYVNPSFERHTGYKLKKIRGKNISIIKSGAHHVSFYRKLWADLRQGKSISKIFINKTNSGKIYYENKTITPIKNDLGKTEFFLSTSKDVTREFMLSKEITKQNKFIQSVVKKTDALIIGLDKNARITLFNGACEKLTGYKFSEVKDKHFIEILIPADKRKEAKRCFIEVLNAKQKNSKCEDTWITKKGQFIRIKWSCTVLREDSGELVVLSTGINVTKEKENEGKLKELNESLDNKVKERTKEIHLLNKRLVMANNLLSKINSNLPAIIYIFNVKTKRITLINNGVNATDMFPYELNKEMPFTEFARQFTSPDTKEIKVKDFFDGSFTREYTLKLNGKVFFMQNRTISFEIDGKSKPLNYLGFMTDVSHIKDVQNKLEQSQKIARLGTWTWDVKTKALYWSDEVYGIFEIDKKKFKPSYNLFLEKIHPEDRELVKEAVLSSLSNRIGYEVAHRIELEDGRIKYIEEKGHVECDENGNPGLMIGTVQDISEARKVQNSLEESQRLAKIGTWEIDLKSGELYWSKEMYKLLELDPAQADMKKVDFLNFIHPEDRNKVLIVTSEAMDKQTDYCHDYRLVVAGTRTKWVRGRTNVEYDKEGMPLRVLGAVQDITTEKLLQEKLKSSYITLQNSLSAIITCNTEGDIEFANNAAIKLFGYDCFESLTRNACNIRDLWDDDDLYKINEGIVHIMQSGSFEPHNPHFIKHKNGTKTAVRYSGSLIMDDKGTSTGLTFSFYDLTLELKHKEVLREQEQKLSLLLSNIDEVVYGIEVDDDNVIPGKTFFLSGKSMDIIGYSLKDIQSMPMLRYELIHPDDYKDVVDSAIQAIIQNKSVTMEYRMYHQLDRQYYWYEDKITTYTNDNGQIVAYYGSIRNISERKQLDLLLVENERKYRSIFENALVGIFRTNLFTQKPVDANNICIKMFGYETKDDFLENFIASDYYADVMQRNELIAELQAKGEMENLEVLFKKKDGTTFWGNTSVKLINEGIMEGVVVDITLRKVYEDQLKKNLAEKDILLKEIHHRVKNNLQVISSLLKLQMEKINQPVLKQAFNESKDRIRAIALVHEKMYLSEELSTINFSDYINSLSRSIYPIYGQKRINLKYDLVDFYTDINMAIPLGLACFEIISNSFKHAFREAESGNLYITIVRNMDKVSISIKDDGCGFDITNVDVNQTLGLSLINNLVKQAKGQLTVKTELLSGSEFLISI